MKLTMMAVYDKKAAAFGRPMFVAAVGLGLRSFTDEVNRAAPDNIMNMHPADFDLYVLGTFDDADASFEVLEKPDMVLNGSACVQRNVEAALMRAPGAVKQPFAERS